MPKADRKGAISKINERGALLVYPVDNTRNPASLWYEFFPRTLMRWEWDEGGDSRVSDLWHLKSELAPSRKVVYTKWYRGRATFFSRPLFTALLARFNFATPRIPPLSANAKRLLDLLEDNSPLSTKVIKRELDMRGKDFEAAYSKMLKELWERLLIVGFGEVDDGAFPSLAVGSTQLLFEDLWSEAKRMEKDQINKTLQKYLDPRSQFTKFYTHLRK